MGKEVARPLDFYNLCSHLFFVWCHWYLNDIILLPNWQMAASCWVGDVHTKCAEKGCPYYVHCCIFLRAPRPMYPCYDPVDFARWPGGTRRAAAFLLLPLLLFTHTGTVLSPVSCFIVSVCNGRLPVILHLFIVVCLCFIFQSWFLFHLIWSIIQFTLCLSERKMWCFLCSEWWWSKFIWFGGGGWGRE